MATDARPRAEPRDGGRRPNALFSVAVLVCASVTMWAGSVPWRDWTLLTLVGPVWVVLGSIWLVAFVTSVARSRRLTAWRSWVLAPLIVAFTLVAMWTEVPVRLRFEPSKSAFEKIVADGSASTTTAGLYDVTSVERTTFGVVFRVSCSGLLWCSGFAYSPAGPPGPLTRELREGVTAYQHIAGPWYAWALRST